MRFQADKDGGVSDVVGTILMLAVTVTIIGLVALQLQSAEVDPVKPLRLDMMSTATDSTHVELLHVGGSVLDRGELRIIVSSGETYREAQIAGASGTTWGMGDTIALTLTAPLPAGPAEVSIVHIGRGEILATGAIGAALGGGTAPGAFSITSTLDGSASPPTVTAPSQVFAEVTVAHADGRKLVQEVHADLSGVDGALWVSLRDDGTRGDTVPGDGKWAAILDVPLSSPRGVRQIVFHATDLTGAEATASSSLTVV